jgi:DNA polymerase elongation subunit (family B)
MKKLFLDIETCGLSESDLAPIMPDFEPDARLTDPAKIKASIESKKRSFLDGAALKATTGRLFAASTMYLGQQPEFHWTPDEYTMVANLTTMIRQAVGAGISVYAWNGHGFDYPFLAQRAAVHKLEPFKWMMTSYRGRYYFNEFLIDPLPIWAMGRDYSGNSLKAVAHALGVGEKTGSGKDFVKLWETDPEAAKKYALDDVRLLAAIVERMGI